MIKKIKSIYNPEYMNRPVLYKTYTKFILSLVVCMLWNRFIRQSFQGMDLVFSVMLVLFLALAWFNYLGLDGVTVGHLMEGWKKKKPNTVQWNKDIADFIDEEVVDYDELQDEEKRVVRLFSNLLTAAVYLVLTIVFTFI